MSGSLILVGTPIGNLGDLSPRGLEALEQADFIAAEDTRVTLKLLNHFGLKKPLVSYYEHNRMESGEKIIRRLREGETCALVTDAGMPVISDPGETLVRDCAAAGIPVTAVPGPCAAVTALALSGLVSGRFTFEGFLSVTKKSRRAHLESLRQEKRTMIFYEAPHKLRATLADLKETFGSERRIALCREMTKLHEETMRTSLGEAADWYAQNEPRGEYVLVVEGAPETADAAPDLESAVMEALRLRGEGMPLKAAVKEVSVRTGVGRNALYEACLAAK